VGWASRRITITLNLTLPQPALEPTHRIHGPFQIAQRLPRVVFGPVPLPPHTVTIANGTICSLATPCFFVTLDRYAAVDDLVYSNVVTVVVIVVVVATAVATVFFWF
jgi:hypothetical protein